mgnify:CR=1 FL=1
MDYLDDEPELLCAGDLRAVRDGPDAGLVILLLGVKDYALWYCTWTIRSSNLPVISPLSSKFLRNSTSLISSTFSPDSRIMAL